MSAHDISDNELAKSHVRYLVGGRTYVPDERLISFGMFTFLSAGGFIHCTYDFQSFLKGLARSGSSCLGSSIASGISLYGITGTTVQVRFQGRTRLNLVPTKLLLHCRADVAKVLVGVQVPRDTADKFQEFLTNLGYSYVDETENPVFKMFLYKEGA